MTDSRNPTNQPEYILLDQLEWAENDNKKLHVELKKAQKLIADLKRKICENSP